MNNGPNMHAYSCNAADFFRNIHMDDACEYIQSFGYFGCGLPILPPLKIY
jgi:hypothetical protein